MRHDPRIQHPQKGPKGCHSRTEADILACANYKPKKILKPVKAPLNMLKVKVPIKLIMRQKIIKKFRPVSQASVFITELGLKRKRKKRSD